MYVWIDELQRKKKKCMWARKEEGGWASAINSMFTFLVQKFLNNICSAVLLIVPSFSCDFCVCIFSATHPPWAFILAAKVWWSYPSHFPNRQNIFLLCKEKCSTYTYFFFFCYITYHIYHFPSLPFLFYLHSYTPKWSILYQVAPILLAFAFAEET